MKNNEFLVIRHSYDDHSYIDGKNDTGLTRDGIEIAKKMAINVLPEIDLNRNVRLRHSTKKRAVETAEILNEELYRHSIDHDIAPDPNLTELFQGNFRNLNLMNHNQKIEFLQTCWEEFDSHRRNGDIDYRFGDNRNSYEKRIDEKFVMHPYGETQRQFSSRIGTSLINICNFLMENEQSINITHRGATREIKNLVHSVNSNTPLEQVKDYEIVGMKYCEIVNCSIDDLFEATRILKSYVDTQMRIIHERNNN